MSMRLTVLKLTLARQLLCGKATDDMRWDMRMGSLHNDHSVAPGNRLTHRNWFHYSKSHVSVQISFYLILPICTRMGEWYVVDSASSAIMSPIGCPFIMAMLGVHPCWRYCLCNSPISIVAVSLFSSLAVNGKCCGSVGRRDRVGQGQ